MTKTISQKLREHALSGYGQCLFSLALDDDVADTLYDMAGYHSAVYMDCDERRMFALFCACALESEQ